MAGDIGLRVGLLVLQIIGYITYIGAQSGDMDLVYRGSLDFYATVEPNSEHPLTDLLGAWSIDDFLINSYLDTEKSVYISVGYKSYINQAPAYTELDKSQAFIVNPSVVDFNVTSHVNGLLVPVDKTLCTQIPKADRIYVQLRVHDEIDDTTLGMHDLGWLHINCPDITFHINCPRGIGVIQGTQTTFHELCGERRSVMVTAGGWYEQTANWTTLHDGSVLPSFGYSSVYSNDTGMKVIDATSNFDGMVINVTEGRCDNHEHMVEFGITDGVFEFSARLFITAWCSFEGYDIMITDTTPITLTQPVRVMDGDVRAAVGDFNFLVEEMGTKPQLVFTNTDGADENVDLYLAAFITQRPSVNMTRERCRRNKHVFDIHGQDILIGKPIPLTDLWTVREAWLDSVDGQVLDNICGRWTMVVSVDVIKTIYKEENICNNYVMYNLSFACDTTQDLPSKMEVIFNPYAAGREAGVRYWGPQGSKFFTFTQDGWNSFRFKKELPGSDMVLNRNGLGRLAVIQKLLQSKAEENCLTDDLTCVEDKEIRNGYLNVKTRPANADELIDEMEGVAEDLPDLPDIDLPGMNDVETLITEMSQYAARGVWDGFNVQKIDEKRKYTITDNLDNVTLSVLKGCFDALKDIASGSNPTIDICNAAYKMDWMSSEAPHRYSQDDAMMLWSAYELAYTWVNRTIYHPDDCSQAILKEYILYLQRYLATGNSHAGLFRKNNKDHTKWNGQNRYCHRANRCVRKILSTCSYKKAAGLRAIADDKQAVCLAYEVFMFHKLRDRALGIWDIKEANAKTDYYVQCPADEELRVRQEPFQLVTVKNGNLYSGSLSPDNKHANLTMVARGQCETCTANNAARRRK